MDIIIKKKDKLSFESSAYNSVSQYIEISKMYTLLIKIIFNVTILSLYCHKSPLDFVCELEGEESEGFERKKMKE